jgi:hypothetical protein
VTTSDEILGALQQVGGGVGPALAAANAAKVKTEEMIRQMAATGVRDKVAEYTAVKAAIEELIASLTASREKAGQVIVRARAAAG